MVKILALGHPRTGTGFTSKILKQMGYDVGHEKMSKDGICCWQFVVAKTGPYPFMKDYKGGIPNYEKLIYNVRNPKTSLPSIVYTENPSFKFRRKICNFSAKNTPLENAIISICTFDRIIRSKRPDIIFRIEDDPIILKNKLQIEREIIFDNSPANKRKHHTFEKMMNQFGQPKNRYIKMINLYAERYNYNKVF